MYHESNAHDHRNMLPSICAGHTVMKSNGDNQAIVGAPVVESREISEVKMRRRRETRCASIGMRRSVGKGVARGAVIEASLAVGR